MSRFVFPLPDLVIPNAQTDSNTIYDYLSGDGFRDAREITIHAPDVLPEAVGIQVDSSVAGANFNPLYRNGAPVTIGPGESITIDGISFKALKLVAAPATAGSRTFKVNKGVMA